MLEFLFAVCCLISFLSLVWGFGSAMNNGTKFSSLGPCLLSFTIFGALALIINSLAGI